VLERLGRPAGVVAQRACRDAKPPLSDRIAQRGSRRALSQFPS